MFMSMASFITTGVELPSTLAGICEQFTCRFDPTAGQTNSGLRRDVREVRNQLIQLQVRQGREDAPIHDSIAELKRRRAALLGVEKSSERAFDLKIIELERQLCRSLAAEIAEVEDVYWNLEDRCELHEVYDRFPELIPHCLAASRLQHGLGMVPSFTVFSLDNPQCTFHIAAVVRHATEGNPPKQTVVEQHLTSAPLKELGRYWSPPSKEDLLSLLRAPTATFDWFFRTNDQRRQIVLQTTFAGLIPDHVRVKIPGYREQFDELLVLAEVHNWNTPILAGRDPLLIGRKTVPDSFGPERRPRSRYFLLEAFDTTPAEALIAAQCVMH